MKRAAIRSMPGLVLASAFGVGLASGATSLADVAATWKGGAGSWTSQNWSTGVYPNDVNGTVYDVFIDGGNATSSSVTLGSSSIGLGSLQIDVEDTLTIGSGGGLGTAALNLAGTITVQSGGQFIAGSSGSQLTLAPTGQLVVNGGALTTGAGTLVLAGNQSLVLENGGSANLAALDTSGHTLSVPASTSLSVTSLTNSSGTVAVTGGAFTVAAMTNGGTIALSGNTTGNSTFFNAYGSAIENNAGGTIRLSDSASYAFTDSISFSGGTLASSGTGAFSATGSFSYMAPMLKDFTLAGTLNMGYYSGLGGSIVNNGTLNINSQVTGSNLMLSGTGTTYINGGSVSAVSNASNVKGYGSFGVGQNHGTIESTIQPGYTYGSLGLTGNSVTNASDGVLLVDPGASMTSYTPNFTSTGQIIVQPGGTFHVSTPTAGTGQSTIASIQNNGTVLITANLNVDSIKGGDVNVQYFAKATAGSFDVHSISVDGTSILTLRPQAAGNGGSTAPLPPTSNFVAGSLSPASTNVTTRIDVTNRDLLVAYGAAQPDPGPAIRNLLIQGYNDAAYFTNGAWNLNGLTSSYAAANHATAVGYADSADGVVGGLAADDLLVRYTLYGDLNLDGRVDAADLMLFAPHYGAVDPAWDAGDLNYDGVVNEADFKLFASNYGESLGGPLQLSAADHSALTDFADSHGLAGDLPVPEPATVLLFGTLSCCLLMYRPRRRADSVLRPNG